MSWDFEQLRQTAQADFALISDDPALENLRIKYLGRKGLVQEIYASLSSVSPDQKPLLGKGANDFKNFLAQLITEKENQLKNTTAAQPKDTLDITLPGTSPLVGHKHILTQTIDEVCRIFEGLGFAVYESPEVETEFRNFTALNIPVDHPSRDAFDTFYVDMKDPENSSRNLLLRSQTSPGQIHILKQYEPPLAVIIPGKVYRPDAVDASHSFMFHQIEGLLVDKNVRFSDLKGLLSAFCNRLFGENIKMRFRPHYFPFTEPSAEVDVSCYICNAKGCPVCKRKGWLEIMGCGMVHPKVFEAVGYPKGKYTGLAFGMGVERMAMLKYGINDIRLFYENDVRFLNQF